MNRTITMKTMTFRMPSRMMSHLIPGALAAALLVGCGGGAMKGSGLAKGASVPPPADVPKVDAAPGKAEPKRDVKTRLRDGLIRLRDELGVTS